MLITALITSALTTKEKLMTMEATRKGVESQTLYMLSSKLSDAADIEAVLRIAVESMSRLLQANVGCVYVGEQAEPVYIQQLETGQLHRSITDVDEIRRKFTNLRTEYLETEENRSFPVNGQNGLVAVTVCVSYLSDMAQVTVRDEGEGIAREDEGNLFQIFYTSKTRASDVRKGIGLGLTICETVVNAHGGTITGRNRKDGKGEEFMFTLPLN